MSKREQEAFTRSYVRVAGRANLSDSEKETLRFFRNTWFDGDDFKYKADKVGVLRRFLEVCAKYKAPVEYMRRAPVRRGQKAGEMFMTSFDKPELNGSCWPAYDSAETWEHRLKLKRDFRIRVMHDEMKVAGIYEIDLGDVQVAKKEAAEVPTNPTEATNVVPLIQPRDSDADQDIEISDAELDWMGFKPSNDNVAMAA